MRHSVWVQGYLQSRKYEIDTPGVCPFVRGLGPIGQTNTSVYPFGWSLTVIVLLFNNYKHSFIGRRSLILTLILKSVGEMRLPLWHRTQRLSSLLNCHRKHHHHQQQQQHQHQQQTSSCMRHSVCDVVDVNSNILHIVNGIDRLGWQRWRHFKR